MNDNQDHQFPLRLTPVGVVRSRIKTPMLLAGESDIELQERLEKIREYHQQVENNICELFIFPQWVDLLDGIDSFSHILVLYWPHLIDPKRRICEKPILWAVKICHCRAYLRPAVRHGRIRFWCRRCFCLNGPYILSK